jgi:chromosome segregation ATPase
MSKSQDRTSEFIAAGLAIEQHLRRLEELSISVRKIRLHTEKSITHAARELQDALQQQEQLGEGLRALGEAMVRIQQRQQVAIESLGARAVEIQKRLAKRNEYMERFAALGTQAGEVTGLLQTLSVDKSVDNGNGAAVVDTASVLRDVDSRLAVILDEAEALAVAAEADDFPEVVREADALKQRLGAARARLQQVSPPKKPEQAS